MNVRHVIGATLGAAGLLGGVLVFAAPAEASSCTASMSPKIPIGYSSLAVGCLIDQSATPSANAGGIEIHDALNAAWHRGSARTVAVGVTANSTVITYASGVVTAADLRRPISGTGIAGGAFIVTAGATSGTVSQRSTATSPATVLKKIEHTNARVLPDGRYPVGGATSTLTSATGAFTATDVNRSVTGGGFGAGARISSVTNATTAVVTPGTTARAGQTLAGSGSRTIGTKNVTGWSGAALVAASDVGATVTGTGIPVGATIAAVVSGTAFTLSVNATTTGTSPMSIAEPLDVLTIGATKYAAASPSMVQTSTDGSTRQITKTTGATCAAGVLTTTTAGGGFDATDIGLPVKFLNGDLTVAGAWKVAASPAPTATTARLTPLTCPAAWTHVVIGLPGANAPLSGDVMASLGASLNLNPAIVSTVDNCTKNTYEGFELSGRWQNPGAYRTAALIGTPLANSVAQIVFDTGLISFAGYVVPKATDVTQVGPHYDIVFPSLPTSSFSVTCPIGAGVTTTVSGLSLSFSGVVATPLTSPPALESGNPSTAGVRALGAATGSFGPKVVLKNGITTLATLTPTPCVIQAATTAPNYSCGIG